MLNWLIILGMSLVILAAGFTAVKHGILGKQGTRRDAIILFVVCYSGIAIFLLGLVM